MDNQLRIVDKGTPETTRIWIGDLEITGSVVGYTVTQEIREVSRATLEFLIVELDSYGAQTIYAGLDGVPTEVLRDELARREEGTT